MNLLSAIAPQCRKFMSVSLVILTTLLMAIPKLHAELLLHYTFNEDSGSALDTGLAPAADGTFVGLATRTTNTPSGTGMALDLSDGNQDYISAGDPPKLNGLTNITLTTWINLRGNPAKSDRIIEKLSKTGGFGWMFTTPGSGSMSSTNFKLALFIDSTSAVKSTADLTADKVLADKQWIFLAMTYDGTLTSGNGRFYYGSTNIPVTQLGNAVTRNAGNIDDTSNELRIGSTAASSADRTPPAWFDDVRIYDTAFSQDELEQVRQETAPNVYAGVPIIQTQPRNITVNSGGDATFYVAAIGGNLNYQWRVNGVNIPGATTNIYSITNVLPDISSFYSVVVSNTYGSTNSVDARLTVNATNMFDTAVMTNIWNRMPDDEFWLTSSGNTSRGLAYDPVTKHPIIVSSSGGNVVVSLDPETGATQFFLDTSIINGATRPLSTVGVADDGAVYVSNLTINATNLPYQIYRWPSDDPGATPAIVFSGDPGGTNYPGLRWGDNLVVRGAGADTEILISPGGGPNLDPSKAGVGTNIVVLLRTTDGVDFQNEVPPTAIQITNAETGFAALGLAFGPGTNTFFAKSADFPLTLGEFDVASQTGFLKQSYSSSALPNSSTAIATDLGHNLLAALAIETPDNVRLYGISDLTRDPRLLDQEAFDTNNANTTSGGTGGAAFGDNLLFVLDSNNGIKAFALNASYTPPPAFSINAQVTTDVTVTLSWPTAAGHLYQVWAKNSLADPDWSKIGLPMSGIGLSVTLTNPVPGVASRFYRVQAQ